MDLMNFICLLLPHTRLEGLPLLAQKAYSSRLPSGMENTTEDNVEGGDRSCQPSSSHDLDPTLLLKELKALEKITPSDRLSSFFKHVQTLWTQWHSFLLTIRGRLTPSDMLHEISHAFFFLCPQKITKIMNDIELQKAKWEALCKILKEKELSLLDLAALVKNSCRKVLFSSSLKDQEARIEVLVAISRAVFSASPGLDRTLSPLVAQTVQQIANSMMKLSSVDLASEFVLQMLCRDSDLAEYFESTFLHRLMVTCASHQRLDQAHLILNEIPSHLQTLEYYKACMTVWGSRKSKPLIHSACLVWQALDNHPTLLADLEAYNLYLLLKARLGQLEEVISTAQKMRRLGFPLQEKSFGIMLQSIGRCKGLLPALNYLPELIESGYRPDSYTSNILLCSRTETSHGACRKSEFINQTPQDRESEFVSTLMKIKSLKYPFDEVTRNLVVRAFLERSYSHPVNQIWTLKEMSLTESHYSMKLHRNQFRRFRTPLYAMLCAAFRRTGAQEDAKCLEQEWRNEKRKARKISDSSSEKVI
ncbi:hypothetical protein PPACK8108_LOCUS5324 [Phakopsora pachyrhizi]|uniref:Uncharacterized protein n=1 Tax=Phakopsora pachyrhizi TaxID=170000 RepID=A0AAV0ANS3_PHAPC|nr:hypothetical protein PPACK8108_LOCUS5324 [Phakopsora pachyrhizi]